MRKAQITIFFILGVVIVLGGITWWATSLKTIEKGKDTESQVGLESGQRSAQLKEYFDGCVERKSYDGLKLIGRHGGYRDIPKSFDLGDAALWQFDNANIQPFLNTTLSELKEYLQIELPKCITPESAQLQGFTLSRGIPQVNAEFANDDVFIQVNYPLTLTQGDFKAEFDEFSHVAVLPFRKIFEVATELNEHTLNPEFKPESPLEGTNGYGYSLSYDRVSPDTILFTVTDVDTVTPDTLPYQFQFAAKFGLTGLEKRTLLQELSSTSPAIYTYEIRSPDNLAALYMLEGTTASLDGSDVEEIITDQGYPPNEFVSGLPGNLNGGSITYVTSNPVYSFEPSGLVFSQPIPLVIHYENSSKTREGVGMLQGEKGMWFPIRSFDNKEGRYVTAYIQGFTNYSAVNCAEQPIKKAEKEDVEHPSGLCYVKLALTVVTLGAALYGQTLAAETLAMSPDTVNVASGTALEVSTNAVSQSTSFFQMFYPPTDLGALVLTGAGYGGASVAMATMLGYGLYGLSAFSLYNTFVGEKAKEFTEQSPENCQNYIPTCSQTVTVSKEEKDGEGMCIPEGNEHIGAGQPSSVCAQVEKCNMLNRFLCMPCSVKCTVSFK